MPQRTCNLHQVFLKTGAGTQAALADLSLAPLFTSHAVTSMSITAPFCVINRPMRRLSQPRLRNPDFATQVLLAGYLLQY
jgi:hypothetical protein